MTYCEVDSFVTKFKYLCHAGIKATLTVDADNGEAFVTLKAGLGLIPPPFRVFPGHGHHSRHQHRGPSYHRRQERRQAARVAAGLVRSPTGEVGDRPPQIDAGLADTASNVSGAEEQAEEVAQGNTAAEDANEKAEQSEQEFACHICDFVSNWASGLQVHMTRKHRNIEQIDGNDSDNEDFEDEKYLETENYWKTGNLGTIFQTFLNANFIVAKSDFSEENKTFENEKILEARKRAFGQNYKYYPPWK